MIQILYKIHPCIDQWQMSSSSSDMTNSLLTYNSTSIKDAASKVYRFTMHDMYITFV